MLVKTSARTAVSLAGAPPRGMRSVALGSFALMAGIAPALAAPIETDPLVEFEQDRAVIAPPNLVPERADPAPIAGPLMGLVFLRDSDSVLETAATGEGIDTRRVPLVDDPAFRARLAPYMGKPISLRLIAEIEAEVANWARARAMPFVSISTPAQEVTGGVLQLRVQEFRIGDRAAIAAGRMTPKEALAGIRVKRGDLINSDALADDLNWLSRSPFRNVVADFAPGTASGATDLTVRVEEARPWLVRAGIDNFGTKSTGRTRFRASATLGDALGTGSVLTYQLATSTDVLDNGLAPFGGHADYQSHLVSAFVPTKPRRAVEVLLASVESNGLSDPFEIRSKVQQAAVGYRMVASELTLPPGSGEVGVGIEYRKATLEGRFDSILAVSNTAEVVQFYAGWDNTFVDKLGTTNVRAEMRVSPGGLSGANTVSAFSAYTSGRVTDTAYTYGNLDLSRTTDVNDLFVLRNDISAQIASDVLIDTEQKSLGGNAGVRGYLLDDGAYDSGLILRNSLYTKPVLFGDRGAVSPFVSTDLGYGANRRGGDEETFASVGGGFDFRMGGNFHGSLYGAVPLTDQKASKSGDVNVMFRIGIQY